MDANLEHCRRMSVCADACTDIPTKALEQGIIREALNALKRIASIKSSTGGAPSMVKEFQFIAQSVLNKMGD